MNSIFKRTKKFNFDFCRINMMKKKNKKSKKQSKNNEVNNSNIDIIDTGKCVYQNDKFFFLNINVKPNAKNTMLNVRSLILNTLQ